jgi:hypothetical protein
MAAKKKAAGTKVETGKKGSKGAAPTPTPKIGAPPTPKEIAALPEAPSKGAPAAPAGTAVLAPAEVSRLAHPLATQIANVGAFVAELAASTTYEEDFGKSAPAQATLRDLFRLAGAWQTEHTHAAAWELLSRVNSERVWDASLRTFEQFKKEYLHALSNDPSIADRWPQANAFVGARSAVAQRGAATKAAKKRAAKKTAK